MKHLQQISRRPVFAQTDTGGRLGALILLFNDILSAVLSVVEAKEEAGLRD